MKAPIEIQREAGLGRDYLQRRIAGEFPLARHIGIRVECAHAEQLILWAPFKPNTNYKGTAFGGSLFCIAVLTGWAWVTRYLAEHAIPADAVVQESNIRYLAPVHGPLRASLRPPPAAQIEKFRRMLDRAGRGRISLQVDVYEGDSVATQFEGVFAAAVR